MYGTFHIATGGSSASQWCGMKLCGMFFCTVYGILLLIVLNSMNRRVDQSWSAEYLLCDTE